MRCHAVLAPPVPTHVDRMPRTISGGQIALVNLYVATLGGKMRVDHADLLFRELLDDLLSFAWTIANISHNFK